METYQIALVIVLIGCVVALFAVWLKNRQAAENPEEPAAELPVPETYSVPDPVAYVPEPESTVPSNQHTIYAFEREVQVYVCPRCDGENSVSRHICCICGYEFKKGVW